MDDGRHDPDLARLRPVSVTNFGAEPAELPAGDILLASGPLTDDGRLPQDTTAWIALG